MPDYNEPIFPQTLYMASNIVEVPLNGTRTLAHHTSTQSPDEPPS